MTSFNLFRQVASWLPLSLSAVTEGCVTCSWLWVIFDLLLIYMYITMFCVNSMRRPCTTFWAVVMRVRSSSSWVAIVRGLHSWSQTQIDWSVHCNLLQHWANEHTGMYAFKSNASVIQVDRRLAIRMYACRVSCSLIQASNTHQTQDYSCIHLQSTQLQCNWPNQCPINLFALILLHYCKLFFCLLLICCWCVADDCSLHDQRLQMHSTRDSFNADGSASGIFCFVLIVFFLYFLCVLL